MLTARKENNPSKSTPFPQRPPKAGSFDKVVGSIDGLRDRVQGFTLEQISEADQKLATMSLGLSALQQRLRMLSEMKDRINRLRDTMQQVETESLEENRLAIDTEPIPVHAVAQIENLLKLRQVIKLIKAAQNVSLTLSPKDQEIQAPVIFEPFEIVSKPPMSLMNREYLATESPLTETPKQEEALGALTEAPDKSEGVYDPDWLEKRIDEVKVISNQAADSTEPHEAVGSILIEDLHLESIDATEYPELNRTFPAEEISTPSDRTQTDAPPEEEADFDRHLLDDLIKNYGEFSIMPSSPAEAKIHQEPKNDNPTSTARTDSSTAVAPASQPTFSLQRKDGELDLKLKKLIKDYGEYDLYSRQTPLKLKTGVIAAFLVLSLVFLGFYFFSSPKSPMTPSVSSASQSQGDSAAPSKETTTVVETSNGEPVSASSVPKGELPIAVDAATSQNPPNKGATKKTK
jgi:hypothetical protein